ncbi:hypothetical protein OPIT5_27305 [Opitutaceae bacterium TAV5]|nr:hypothetical protein OPIT5_27305 [Opitutaceae bacterium TAV5]
MSAPAFPSVPCCCLLLTLAGSLLPFSRAATISWNPSAPANGDWEESANWTGGAVPGSADDVRLQVAGGGSSVLSGSAAVRTLWVNADNALTLDGPEASLGINAGTQNYALFMYGGNLTVRGGATLTTSLTSPANNSAKSAYLGHSDTASVLVTGTGSSMTFNQRLYVAGGTGQGTVLTISDNATVSAYSTSIAGQGDGSGTVIVDGGTFTAASQLSYGSFNIGNYGTGTLKITNNGVVTNSLSGASIGNQAGAIGLVEIDSGSWKSSSHIEVGGYGSGTLDISGGAVSNTTGYIGRYAGSTGNAMVSGAGKWNSSSTLYVGYSGEGELTIDGPDAEVTAGSSSTTYVGYNTGSSGTVNLKNGAVWTLRKLAGRNGASTVNFDNGVLKARQADSSFISNIGTMNILAGGATIDSAGYDIGITGNGFSGEGRLTKTGAGTLTLSAASTHRGGLLIETGSVIAGHAAALGAGVTTITAGTSLDSIVADVATGGLLLQDGGTLTTNGAAAGSWTLSDDFVMTGGTYHLDILAIDSFDRIVGDSGSSFDLISGAIVLALHEGFDYNESYLVFSGFGSGTDTRDGNVQISGYDDAWTAWIDSDGYLRFEAAVVPEPATSALLAGAGILTAGLLRRGIRRARRLNGMR